MIVISGCTLVLIGAGRHERLVGVSGIPTQRVRKMRKGICKDFLADRVRAGSEVWIIWHFHTASRIDWCRRFFPTLSGTTRRGRRRVRNRLPWHVSAGARDLRRI